MKNILVVTSSFDLTVDYVLEKYRDEYGFFRLNLDKYDNYRTIISQSKVQIFDAVGRKCDLSRGYSIWFRKPTLPSLPMPRESLEYAHKEIFAQIEGIIEAHEGIVTERPCTLRRANNKILQLKLASHVGFQTADSWITNDQLVIEQQLREQKIIIKPISIGVIKSSNRTTFLQTEIVDPNDKLPNLRYCPSYFQEYLHKDYEVRLTIAGSDFFAARIDSDDKTDWRRGRCNSYQRVDVPPEIIQKCFQMLDLLGIKFGAFDFIVSNGEYYFLEVNPNGQWLWLERELGFTISDSVLRLLTRG